jgi:hypothetical protein
MDNNLKEMNEAWFSGRLHSPSNIYLDLRLFKDIYLGTILDMISTSEEYNYIFKNLKTYPFRYIDKLSRCFPELPFTDEQIEEHLSTMDHDKLFQTSPNTVCFMEFLRRVMDINNKTAVKQDTNVVNLTINTYPLTLSDNISQRMIVAFGDMFAMNISTINKHIDDIPLEEMLSYDECFIYDLKSLLENSIYSKAFTDLKFEDITIYAPRQIKSLEVLEVLDDPEKLESDFLETETFLKLICRFTYLPPLFILIDGELKE